MCIAIPGKVVSIKNENTAIVDFGGIKRNINLDLIGGADESLIGKYVLVHVGYAISVMSDEEGEETLKLINELLDAG